jgi:hypothetical protein
MEERLAFLSSVSSTNGPLMNNVAIFLAARKCKKYQLASHMIANIDFFASEFL